MHRLRPGDRRRRRAPLTYWLLVRGRGERPLPAGGWTLERHASTRRPAIQEGDLAICYAAVWQALFALVEISSPPEHDPERERWAWSFGIRPLAALRDLHDAPAAEEAGIFPSSLWRHSYIRLTDEQFARACLLLERALVRTGCDTVGEAYERWAAGFHAPAPQTLERLTEHLPTAPASRR